MSILRSTLAAVAGLTLSLSSSAVAGGGVTISSYGQRSLLIQGGGQSVLLNPFRSVGCAAGLAEPRVNAGVILASSELADEGARGVAGGRFLVSPGSYRIGGLKLEGFASPTARMVAASGAPQSGVGSKGTELRSRRRHGRSDHWCRTGVARQPRRADHRRRRRQQDLRR